MKVAEFNYTLPEELIAQHPYEKRDEARLMVLDKSLHTIEHKVFSDVIDYLDPGDCLVINDTKVIPARLYGVKDTGAKVEFLLLNRIENDDWQVIVKPGNKLKPGSKVIFGDNELRAEVLDILDGGTRKVHFEYDGIFNEILDKIGLMPLPPYIKENIKEENDKYQTVYAKYEGSAAAPTAGLHFTKELLDKIKAKGVEIAKVTLHVGIGTFRPVKVENVEDHHMHTEHFYIKQEDADKINNAKLNGHKIVAVGTTSCRTLESVADEKGLVKAQEGDTGIFIYPGYIFKCIDRLITNFHLPESTLIMLVSSLAGKDFILQAYNTAVKEKYKFFSFGDAMIIL